MIVDEMHEEHPELLRDQYWECVVPKDLPYTVASEHYRKDEPKGSAEKYKVKKEDAMYANIMPGGGKRMLSDDVYADYVSIFIHFSQRSCIQHIDSPNIYINSHCKLTFYCCNLDISCVL